MTRSEQWQQDSDLAVYPVRTPTSPGLSAGTIAITCTLCDDRWHIRTRSVVSRQTNVGSLYNCGAT